MLNVWHVLILRTEVEADVLENFVEWLGRIPGLRSPSLLEILADGITAGLSSRPLQL
jgi:hypothetical protein